jgi:hypothetical protein
MISILRKAQNKKLLTRRNKSFLVNDEMARKLDFSEKQKHQESKNNKFKGIFRKFLKNEFDMDITDEDIETVILSFLKKNDIEILIFSLFYLPA